MHIQFTRGMTTDLTKENQFLNHTMHESSIVSKIQYQSFSIQFELERQLRQQKVFNQPLIYPQYQSVLVQSSVRQET